jgi:hypothetical protein
VSAIRSSLSAKEIETDGRGMPVAIVELVE